ncbi:MAG: ABC transporter ATP-binding protein [Scardovia wiggsiae]|uniref:ABC transporter ATP-binding protein n=1 Tax=Scardovia wiggsiae TaxID=230143 RepID=UPI001CB1335A|nr:ABC transporter ATP-binding protein [Scardovia wiggsiae]
MTVADNTSSSHLPVADSAATRRRVLEIVKGNRRELAALVVLHVCAIGMGILSPLLFGWLIDTVTGAPVPLKINIWILFSLLCMALALQAFLTWCAQRASWRFGENIFMRLRNDVIDGVTQLPLITVERAGRGDIIARTTNDIDAVSEAVRVGLPESLVAALYVLFASASSFMLDWRIALVSVAGLPFLFFATRWYTNRSQHAYERELRSHGEFDSISSEAIEAARTIDLLNDSERVSAGLRHGAQSVSKAERYTLSLQQWWFPMVQLGYYLPFALVAVAGGIMSLNGQASIGTVVAITMNTQLVVDPLDDLLYWADQLQLAWAALRRMSGVSVLQEAGYSDGKYYDGGPSGGCVVEADNLYVEYEKGNPVIQGASLRISEGEHVALIGPSGAGKTTLALALCGLISPSGGSAEVFYPSSGLQGKKPRIMFVAQEPQIFTGTLRFNLLLAAPGADDDAIRRALDYADVPELYGRLDDDADSLELDPVARQKIALARVALADPDFVVLDEAMSMFSLAEVKHSEQLFEEVLKGKTVIIIAHRLHTAMGCDRVIVMDHCCIVEQGPPEKLRHSGGKFSALYRKMGQK